MKRKATVLVVDDEQFVRDSLVAILQAEGLRTLTAGNATEGLAQLDRERVHLVITDLNMPGGDGLELLRQMKARGLAMPVIVLTGVGKVATAVEAMRQGAYDFIQKPVDPQAFLLLIERAIEHGDLVSEVTQLRSTIHELRAPVRMVGASSWFKKLEQLLDQVAPTDATVLVTGESGTGKELVANELHHRSHRARRPLVRVNCAAITETLFESEFFGHRRGAFTGAVADRAGRFAEAEGGTLVLDEISTLRMEMQAKLLRVLESGEFQVVGESNSQVADVRVVAVSNEDLVARVAAGTFRSDLYYRLAIFPINVPPLRERRDDVPALANALVRRLRAGLSGARGRDGVDEDLSAEAVDALLSYHWPGNVRELRNVMERALILSSGRPPGAEVLRGVLESAMHASAAVGGRVVQSGDLTLRARLDALEGELLSSALRRTGGSKKEAAELLGIDPKNLSYYLRKHQLSEKGEEGKPAPSGAPGAS